MPIRKGGHFHFGALPYPERRGLAGAALLAVQHPSAAENGLGNQPHLYYLGHDCYAPHEGASARGNARKSSSSS